MLIINLIKSSPLFLELYDSEVEIILKKCKVMTLKPNDYIFHEGETGNELYIILTGEAIVKKGDVVLASLSTGDRIRSAKVRNFY